jgi:hypothetical protein
MTLTTYRSLLALLLSGFGWSLSIFILITLLKATKVIGIAVLILITVGLLPTTREHLKWHFASLGDKIQDYTEYLEAWPNGRHAAEARLRQDERSWSDARAGNTLESFKHYEQVYPNGAHLAEAHMKIEDLTWQQSTSANTITSLRAYDNAYPSGRFVAESQARQVELRTDDTPYTVALQKETDAAIKEFLREFPGHTREPDARSILKRLAPAVVVVDYPKYVAASHKMVYQWETIFKESSGKSRYKVTATDCYIRDPGRQWRDGKWPLNWGPTIDVDPGGVSRANFEHVKVHSWGGGYFHCVWIGEDEYGNKISIVQEVLLLP